MGLGASFNLLSTGSTGLGAQGEGCSLEAAVTGGIPEQSFWTVATSNTGLQFGREMFNASYVVTIALGLRHTMCELCGSIY